MNRSNFIDALCGTILSLGSMAVLTFLETAILLAFVRRPPSGFYGPIAMTVMMVSIFIVPPYIGCLFASYRASRRHRSATGKPVEAASH